MAIDPSNVSGPFITKRLHSGLMHDYLGVQVNTQIGYDYDTGALFAPITNYIIKRLEIDAMFGFSSAGLDTGSSDKIIQVAVQEVESGGTVGTLNPTYPSLAIYTPSSSLSYLLDGAHNFLATSAFTSSKFERIKVDLSFDSETFLWKKNAKLYFSSIAKYAQAVGSILGNYTIILTRPPTGYHYNDSGEIIIGEDV